MLGLELSTCAWSLVIGLAHAIDRTAVLTSQGHFPSESSGQGSFDVVLQTAAVIA
jgi:hypothetical protein